MLVKLDWRYIGARSLRWQWNRCLYAYVHPAKNQLLYIGKADGSTVRGRFVAPDKEKFFEFIEEKLGLQQTRVVVAQISLEEGYRFSSELLKDIESLLIKRIRPVGNVSAIRTRTSRPGLRVVCTGDWPHSRSSFLDVG